MATKTNRYEQERIQDRCDLAPNTVNYIQILVPLQLDYCGAYSGTARFRENTVYILYTKRC